MAVLAMSDVLLGSNWWQEKPYRLISVCLVVRPVVLFIGQEAACSALWTRRSGLHAGLPFFSFQRDWTDGSKTQDVNILRWSVLSLCSVVGIYTHTLLLLLISNTKT